MVSRPLMRILFLLLILQSNEGFKPIHRILRRPGTLLQAKPGRSGAGNKKPSSKTSSRGASKSSPKQPMHQASAPAKNKQTKSTPPWQVMGTKDQKRNVEKEIERRQLVRDGHKNPEVDKPQSRSKAFLSDPERRYLNWKRFNPEKAKGMEFVGAYLNRNLPPRLGAPEVAFLGRSNVGKSSLLNRLTGTSQARVGKTPGATASVNLYQIVDDQQRALLGLVDLPGFGYAKLSKTLQDSVMEAAEMYLNRRKELALGILLVDLRRTPSDDDRAVLAALYDMGVPLLVVATKADKVSNNERERNQALIREELGLPDGQPFTISSVTGEGCKSLWKILLEACETKVAEDLRKYTGEMTTDNGAGVEVVDEDEMMYDQGFDWIHDSSVMYEDDDDEENTSDDEKDEGDFFYEEDSMDDFGPRRETMRDLRQRAKDMEKRGNL